MITTTIIIIVTAYNNYWIKTKINNSKKGIDNTNNSLCTTHTKR